MEYMLNNHPYILMMLWIIGGAVLAPVAWILIGKFGAYLFGEYD